MSKVQIITDSNSGINQIAAKQLGIKVVPMPFTIDGEEYLNATIAELGLTPKYMFNIIRLWGYQLSIQSVYINTYLVLYYGIPRWLSG